MLLRIKQSLRLRTRFLDARRWLLRYHWGWLILQDWWIDRRFGASCGGTIESPFADQGATRTESATYRTLARLFGQQAAHIDPADVLVDVGCGKGRVLNYWLRAGLRNPLIGIELTPEVGAWTRARLAPFDNVGIVIGDAVEVLPANGTVFFLFNPFGRDTMAAFARQLLARTERGKLRVVYLNARHLDVFDGATWKIESLDSGSPDTAFLIRPAE
jgi:SAM-dependent methyltransferase